MTIFEFSQLEKKEQAKIINQYGVFVAEKTESGNRKYLYMVNYFYVELFHELSALHNRGIVISNVFDDQKFLKEYHEQAGRSFNTVLL